MTRRKRYTIESLREEIFSNEKPKYWRDGQFVFNYIDKVYGIARLIQFNHRIDCYYIDDNIPDFLKAAVDILNEKNIRPFFTMAQLIGRTKNLN